MQSSNINCQRHPQNVISHVCTLNECNFRFLCSKCIEEKRNHEHNAINKEQLLVKLENEINHWKYQMSFEAQCQQKIKNIRHFKRVINKLYEEIKQMNKSYQNFEQSNIQVYTLNEMEQELQKLKTGNLGDLNYYKLIFCEDQGETYIEIFSKINAKLQIINQDIQQAIKISEQILNYQQVDQQKQDIKEDIFYQNCQKMCFKQSYYEIKHCFQNDSLDLDQQIRSLLSANCDQEQDSTIEFEEKIKNIAISAYLVCKEMKYDLEVNDLFEILSQFSNPSMATNIEDIVDYK